MDSVHAIKKLRPWTRPFLVPRLPEVQPLHEIEKGAADLLSPLVGAKCQAAKGPNWEKLDDLTQYMLNRFRRDMPVEEIAEAQFVVIVATIHTTSITTTNFLFTLATMPEYVATLRGEMRVVLAEHNGTINTKALRQMEDLDSFMMEVSRA